MEGCLPTPTPQPSTSVAGIPLWMLHHSQPGGVHPIKIWCIRSSINVQERLSGYNEIQNPKDAEETIFTPGQISMIQRAKGAGTAGEEHHMI